VLVPPRVSHMHLRSLRARVASKMLRLAAEGTLRRERGFQDCGNVSSFTSAVSSWATLYFVPLALTSCLGLPSLQLAAEEATCATVGWLFTKTSSPEFPHGAWPTSLTGSAHRKLVVVMGMVVKHDDGDLVSTVPFIFVESLDGILLPAPPIPAAAIHPRLVVGANDRLYLFWGEAADPTGENLRYAWRGTANRIRYATHATETGWSQPFDLAESSNGFWWPSPAGSLVRSPAGDIHLVLSIQGSFPGTLLHAVIPPQGHPRHRVVHTVESRLPHTALHVRDDTILIAYTSLSGEHADHAVRIRLSRSDDGGASWRSMWAPVLLHTSGITWLQFEEGPLGTRYLLVGRGPPGSPLTERFVLFRSTDGGRTWIQSGELNTPAGAQHPQLSTDQFGTFHLLFWELTATRARVLHTRWSGGTWSEPMEAIPGRDVGSFVVYQDSAQLHLVFSDAASQIPELGWARLEPRADATCAPPTD
jgi:hypothetical protein